MRRALAINEASLGPAHPRCPSRQAGPRDRRREGFIVEGHEDQRVREAVPHPLFRFVRSDFLKACPSGSRERRVRPFPLFIMVLTHDNV